MNALAIDDAKARANRSQARSCDPTDAMRLDSLVEREVRAAIDAEVTA